MNIRVFQSAAEIGAFAGKLLCDFVRSKPDAVLGFATGITPLPTYGYMVEEYAKGAISFKGIRTFNLDEYCDLPREHKNSFYSFMMDNLFGKIDVLPENIDFLDGNTTDPDAESARYSESIKKAGGIDIQLLGIGTNGHIGFNEPADEFTGEAFKVKLTDSTIKSNSVYFDDIAMPHYAVTMGIRSILKAKKLLFIATGEAKSDAVYAMVNGEITPRCPASVLQEHGDVLVLLDEAAASKL